MQESIETMRTELEQRLRFETLLAELSARFVNLPAARIDGEIEGAQRRICELLDIDRSTLWQVCEGEPGTLLLTHFHHVGKETALPRLCRDCDVLPACRGGCPKHRFMKTSLGEPGLHYL
jgi:radical SAM protein with 4Fe4S-binding SPASM domain